jgi:dCMP deaminase
MNALLQASHYGIKIAGATLYTTTYPCSLCAKMLVNAGIKRIVTLTDYPDALAKEILAMANIKVEIVKLDNIPKE